MATKMQLMNGTIKWFNKKKGYGFISPDNGNTDIYLHNSELQIKDQNRIKPGDRITFSIKQQAEKQSAIQVTFLPIEVKSLNTVLKKERTRKEPPKLLKSEITLTKTIEDIIPDKINDSSKNFADLGINLELQRAVLDAGYTNPTPIQTLCIPQVLAGKDILGAAQTGTGKTAAFALPILQRLTTSLEKTHLNEKKKRENPDRSIKVLVLSPTRELAIQIGEFFTQYGQFIKQLKNTVVFGGVKQNAQVKALQDGVDILVATPGRLLDLIGQGFIKLNHVEVLVFDEADRMLDMGFIHDVQKIMKYIPHQRQTLMYSATLPKEIMQLAGDILHDPVRVSVSPEKPTVEAIEQVLYHVHKKEKQRLLNTILKNREVSRVLVFSQTKHGANKIVKELEKIGIIAQPLHGNKSQNARQLALHNFKTGITRVIVATDVASRGLDVEDVTHVIQYDLPKEPETYVHRIGRTGRAGMTGIAISFCDETEHSLLRDIERLIKKSIPVVGEK